MQLKSRINWSFILVFVGMVSLAACEKAPILSIESTNHNAESQKTITKNIVAEITPNVVSQEKGTIKSEKPSESNLVVYNGKVEHLFFHPLIAYPEMAFKHDKKAAFFNDWFVTVNEFNKILNSLYKENFILIDIHMLYEEKTIKGRKMFSSKQLMLPAGKKPLIISVDDLNYYDSMLSHGTVQKLVLDDTGNVAAYSVTPNGEKKVSHDNEIIPILDNFINVHKDFSFEGSKGIIALTGYQGILGYRTQKMDSPTYAKDKKEAIAVIKRIKETGWTFASHGYAHLNAPSISYDKFVNDTKQWIAEVEPLIGHTALYVYPFGSSVPSGSAKFKYLMDSGFQVMLSVGPLPYLNIMDNFITMDRRHIDGIALHSQRAKLLGLFDSNQIIDSVRPKQY